MHSKSTCETCLLSPLLIHSGKHLNLWLQCWPSLLFKPVTWPLVSPPPLHQVTSSARVSSSVPREWWRTPAPWAWPCSSGSSRASSPPSERCATPSWASPSPSRGETTPTLRTSSEGWPGEWTRDSQLQSVWNNQWGVQVRMCTSAWVTLSYCYIIQESDVTPESVFCAMRRKPRVCGCFG